MSILIYCIELLGLKMNPLTDEISFCSLNFFLEENKAKIPPLNPLRAVLNQLRIPAALSS